MCNKLFHWHGGRGPTGLCTSEALLFASAVCFGWTGSPTSMPSQGYHNWKLSGFPTPTSNQHQSTRVTASHPALIMESNTAFSNRANKLELTPPGRTQCLKDDWSNQRWPLPCFQAPSNPKSLILLNHICGLICYATNRHAKPGRFSVREQEIIVKEVVGRMTVRRQREMWRFGPICFSLSQWREEEKLSRYTKH